MLVYCLLLICCFTISPFCWVNFFDSLDKCDFDLFIWFSLVIIKFNYKRKLSCLHIYGYGKLFSLGARYRSGSEMFGRPLLSIFNEKLFLKEFQILRGSIILWKKEHNWGGILPDYRLWMERRNSASFLKIFGTKYVKIGLKFGWIKRI